MVMCTIDSISRKRVHANSVGETDSVGETWREFLASLEYGSIEKRKYCKYTEVKEGNKLDFIYRF